MNINHLVISGNLTRDPETRAVGSDKAVVSFTIANNSKYKSSDGEQREETSFVDVEVWGRQGEVAAQYCTKGSTIIVEGRIKQDSWTDKEGQKRSKLKLVADKIHLPPRAAKGESAPTVTRTPVSASSDDGVPF